MARRAELSVRNAVAHLRLVRAEAANAIDAEMVAALDAAVSACTAAEGVRAVLISAQEPAFSVGGDLRHLVARLDRLPDELDEMIGDARR